MPYNGFFVRHHLGGNLLWWDLSASRLSDVEFCIIQMVYGLVLETYP